MVSTIEDVEASKGLNKTDIEVPHIVSSLKIGLVLDETIKENKRTNCNRSVRYFKSLDTCFHIYVEKYESLN